MSFIAIPLNDEIKKDIQHLIGWDKLTSLK